MLKAFFGFTHFPFKKDIEKIFISAQLAYLQKRCAHFLETQGIALLTGEVGSGKTTFMRHFLDSLNHNSYQCFYFSQTVRTARSFFRALAVELGLLPKFFIEDVSRQVKTELVNIFRKQKLLPILIIDEAQNLSDMVLEEIRLLTNFKMDSKNYLSVFLLGHPALKARLKLSPYTALRQRISFSYHLTGLEQDEVDPYLIHRLKLAGRSKSVFTSEAVTLLFNYSKGLPRVINTLAHEALFLAASKEKNMVDESLIEKIVQEWETL
ncbi:MAG: AAA family ATPase [Candidatus Margulisbacteria bacterium]|nr:AAA family ATPase [Candidatus Margulisiibacteriota bacterium]